jgi:hypothetical protein
MKRPKIGSLRFVIPIVIQLSFAFLVLFTSAPLHAQEVESAVNAQSSSTCELNAPLSEEQVLPSRASTSSWVVKKGSPVMLTTAKLQIMCECANCPSCAAACNNGLNGKDLQCPAAQHQANLKAYDQSEYCADVATHLATTLVGSKESTEAQKRAIDTALKMVSENASAVAEARFESMQRSHQKTIESLRSELASVANAAVNSVATSPSVEALYAAQYRNTQQIKTLSKTNRKMLETMGRLELHLDNLALSQRAKFSNSEAKRMISSVEENKRYEQEVEKLQRELKMLDDRIERLQPKPNNVRPASFLEPVYNRETPLAPIRRTIKR